MRARILVGAMLAAVVGGLLVTAPPVRAAQGSGPCAHITDAEPQTAHNMPPPAPGYITDPANPPAYPHFAPDFPLIKDCEWGYPIGGFGGIRRRAPLNRVPVVFVHGNQVDAENWFLVRDQFLKLGWTDQEMYAISYNGLENWYAGAPTQSQPDASTQAYLAANSTALGNGGKGTADDVNVPDVYAFVQAVMDYTGSPYVDIVAHSLGVTIVRKMMYDHRWLYGRVLVGVMIAGASHGTSVCYQLQASYYGCDEIAPDDPTTGYVNPWLKQLNSIGEAPGPTCWQTIYDGTGGDPLFDPPYTQSPHQQGADNHGEFAGMYHNDLRVSPTTVAVYSAFLLQHGQLGTFRPCGTRVAGLSAAPGPVTLGASTAGVYAGSAGLPAPAARVSLPQAPPAPFASQSTIPRRLIRVLAGERAGRIPVAALGGLLLLGLVAAGCAWAVRRRPAQP